MLSLLRFWILNRAIQPNSLAKFAVAHSVQWNMLILFCKFEINVCLHEPTCEARFLFTRLICLTSALWVFKHTWQQKGQKVSVLGVNDKLFEIEVEVKQAEWYLFQKLTKDTSHCLQSILPLCHQYEIISHMRPRGHNFFLLKKALNLLRKSFIFKCLFEYF